MSMIILSKEEVERIVNSFDCAEKLTFSDFIDFEPDCKIYKLKDNNGDNFLIDSNIIKIFSLSLKILTILNIFFHWHELLSGKFLNFFVLI